MARLRAPSSARRSALSALVLAAAIACSGPNPPPPPARVVPTAAPSPSPGPAAQLGEDPADVRDAFLDEIRDATDELLYLAGGQCGPLGRATKDDPGTVGRIQTFATTLKKLATQDRTLATREVQDALRDLDDAMAGLDETLDKCGLKPGQVPGVPPSGPAATGREPMVL